MAVLHSDLDESWTKEDNDVKNNCGMNTSVTPFRKAHALADEEEIYFSWVNQINVRQGIHSLQTRVDATVQLRKKSETSQWQTYLV